MIMNGDKCLYNVWSKKLDVYFDMDIQDAIELISKTKKPFHKKTILLAICATGDN